MQLPEAPETNVPEPNTEEGFALYLSGEDDGQFIEFMKGNNRSTSHTFLDVYGNGLEFLWLAGAFAVVGWMLWNRFRKMDM